MAQAQPSVIRLTPQQYVHILNNNSNVTRVVVGPISFARQDHEKLVFGPETLINVPPRHYCVVRNPVLKNAAGEVQVDKNQQYLLRHGDEEIRFEGEPFPLYPGEEMVSKRTQPLQVVKPDAALRLRATRDFTDENKVGRMAGDEWLFRGPGTYVPRVEVVVVSEVKAVIVGVNQAIQLRAIKEFEDKKGGKTRKAGEEYLMREPGAYIPDVHEQQLKMVDAVVLTDKRALHLRATRSFTDRFGKHRKAGEEWLLTIKECDAHIPDVCEEVVHNNVPVVTLTSRQYCVILDPWDAKGRVQLGARELRKGEVSFFLNPGERLENGVEPVNVLGEDESLLLRARETYEDDRGLHKPGDRWMIRGPMDYVPPVEVEVVERRRAIPLDENEGVYVRNVSTGRVKMIVGKTYMLEADEELWQKDLPQAVEDLLADDTDPRGAVGGRGGVAAPPSVSRSGGARVRRDVSRVVSFRAPHNTAIQVYDYQQKQARVCFGPGLVMLGPDEQFTVLSLSGGKPKEPNKIRAVALQLGPDFMTDIVRVETSDHARLDLQLSYNWHFEVDKKSQQDAAKIFQVPDFVGDACKAVASRVRGTVASVPFDQFHRNSAKIIRKAVFGEDENGKIRGTFNFQANGLVITNVDIQSVEPVDAKTREALSFSVQQAIEITTKSQEASAKHEAERVEQEARGKLERQRLKDEADAEASRKRLLELQAESAAVQSTGQAKAEARARAEAAAIEGKAAVAQADLSAQAKRIAAAAELDRLKQRQSAELEHIAARNQLEIEKQKEFARIEAEKFKQTVSAIGTSTLAALARSGPEMQAELLKGLGLQSMMITDGKSPINLFSTASGLVQSHQ